MHPCNTSQIWIIFCGLRAAVSWGADQNEEILGRALQSRASTSDTTLPRSLPDLSCNKREEEHTENCTQAYYPSAVEQHVQADLVGLQMVPDNGYKFILNYQDCLSKYIILRPLKTKTAAEVTDCLVSIFFEHGPPSILHTDNGTEFSNKTLMSWINELWKGTKIVHGSPSIRRARGAWSGLMETSRTCPTPDSGMSRRNAISGSVSYLMYSILRILLFTVLLTVRRSMCILGGTWRTLLQIWPCPWDSVRPWELR